MIKRIKTVVSDFLSKLNTKLYSNPFAKTKPTSNDLINQEINQEVINNVKKDKLFFQRNNVKASDPLTCSSSDLISTSPEIPINDSVVTIKNKTQKVTFECDERSIEHLNNLCRFFELSQTDAINRGVWLLTLARDVELLNKKIGIIAADNNGVIVEIIPLNIV